MGDDVGIGDSGWFHGLMSICGICYDGVGTAYAEEKYDEEDCEGKGVFVIIHCFFPYVYISPKSI